MDSIVQLPVGTQAPDFTLLDLEGRPHALHQYGGKVVVLYFWSVECPWVERCDHQLNALQKGWGEAVALLPVASNADEATADRQLAAYDRQLACVLEDPDQSVARLYAAQATPHLFVIDGQGLLRYRGALDDMTYRNRTPGRFYVAEAVNALLEGRSPETPETPPYGCAVVGLVED